MKKTWIGLHALLVFLTTTAAVAVAAEEAKEGGSYAGYDTIYLIWKTLAGGLVVWGAYDSFFRPDAKTEAMFDPKASQDPEWKLRFGKFLFYLTAAAGVYFFYWFAVIQCPC